MTIDLNGTYKDLKICMRNVDSVENVKGASWRRSEAGAVLDAENGRVTFRCGDTTKKSSKTAGEWIIYKCR